VMKWNGAGPRQWMISPRNSRSTSGRVRRSGHR
jgi:hypothetical protein